MKKVKLGKFKISRKEINKAAHIIPSSGTPATEQYKRNIAYKNRWRAERKNIVSHVVREEMRSIMDNAIAKAEKLTFKIDREFTSATHLYIAMQEKKRMIKELKRARACI